MVRAYWDTSALVPLYAPEIYSAAATKALVRCRGGILLTPLNELELVNAIQLRIFRQEIAAVEAAAARAAIARDRDSGLYICAPLSDATYTTAAELALAHTHRHGVRSLDLLHVAAAIELKAEMFLSFDKRQRALASAAGLSVA
ncbi:MAG: PIN domain-containing protein [Acidobacteria bacterium]|nr:MAG: PIN domain-containing protein [Acidobacteriota bacterium]